MLVDPKLQEVALGDRGMLQGIQACLDQQCLVSSVTLIFSAIDALAALTRPVTQPETDGATFQAWVKRFFHPEKKLNCTSVDLWGARCGVLHTYSPEAPRASRAGARRVYYQWRQGPNAVDKRPLPAGSLVIVIEDLHAALISAIHTYVEEACCDPVLKTCLEKHLPSLLCYVPHDPLMATNAT
jgi:hypothetical protein